MEVQISSSFFELDIFQFVRLHSSKKISKLNNLKMYFKNIL